MCQGLIDFTKFVALACGLDESVSIGLVEKTDEIFAADLIRYHHNESGHVCRVIMREPHERFGAMIVARR